MGRLIVFLGIILAIFTSCERSYRDVTLYQSSGGTKPIVAVLPVIDSSHADDQVTWDISRELTEEIRKRVYNSPKIYLLREEGTLETAMRLNRPTSTTLTKDVVDDLGAAEFVIVSEFLEQKQSPYSGSSKKESGALLSLAMRVRVLDIRGKEPKVILQEVLNHEHVVSKAYMDSDYNRSPWGTEAFERTPLGMAHSKLVRELVSRVEGYVGAHRG